MALAASAYGPGTILDDSSFVGSPFNSLSNIGSLGGVTNVDGRTRSSGGGGGGGRGGNAWEMTKMPYQFSPNIPRFTFSEGHPSIIDGQQLRGKEGLPIWVNGWPVAWDKAMSTEERNRLISPGEQVLMEYFANQNNPNARHAGPGRKAFSFGGGSPANSGSNFGKSAQTSTFLEQESGTASGMQGFSPFEELLMKQKRKL